jgi:allophanate hydrolase subunit 1
MTKLTTQFQLQGPLNEALLTRLSDVHKIYGINMIQLGPAMKSILVEYDASRLNLKEVEAALRQLGMPIELG